MSGGVGFSPAGPIASYRLFSEEAVKPTPGHVLGNFGRSWQLVKGSLMRKA